MDASSISVLLAVATLLPLASFALILCFGPKLGKSAAFLSIGAIMGAAVLSFLSLFLWLKTHWPENVAAAHHGSHAADHHDDSAEEHSEEEHSEAEHAEEAGDAAETAADEEGAEAHDEEVHDESHAEAAKPAYYGEYYLLGLFGDRRVAISYYIDSLTVVMFCMVTLIASCIHWYATGYMHDELHEVTDHEVTDSHGHHLHRPGRFPRFFQSLSLFCFSMLGLVLAGNIAMVFVFWELVGICSYFLIGFYVERKSASNAANKAFIVNRVGDFGMIIGLMALWSGLGTFAFGDLETKTNNGEVVRELGMFSLVRSTDEDVSGALHPGAQVTPVSMISSAASVSREDAEQVRQAEIEIRRLQADARRLQAEGQIDQAAQARARIAELEKAHGKPMRAGYWLLIIAGLGIFCGCVGKSAQFPLHVWLPDAMEGPTPVSALVHSATMVAAGVYLVGRFYPMFTPEVLLVIASVGCITLFLAATIAITATDIKRVLAYSTVSQLGYMMLALGVGGWTAGLLHLITHAFFKSLLFLCSGSVIHAVHTNEMPLMGGLLKKMPITALTMLVGCLAIIGASIPFVIGLSGYYSKDAILEQAFSFMQANDSPLAGLYFFAAAGGAAITAFYMFRLWFMTFLGKPRDHHRYDHAHESPKVMYVPLLILAFFAITVAWQPLSFLPGKLPSLSLVNLLEQARPEGVSVFDAQGGYISFQGLRSGLVWPNEFASHEAQIKVPVTLLAFAAGIGGVTLAAAFYWFGYLDPAEVRRSFQPVYRLLINKWYFDELYNFLFVKPVFVLARLAAAFDRGVLDWIVDHSAIATRWFARKWELVSDQIVVDGFVNLFANWVYSLALSFRTIQTGRLRQYVMFIVLGAVMVLVLISVLWSPVAAQIPALGEPGVQEESSASADSVPEIPSDPEMPSDPEIPSAPSLEPPSPAP